MTIAAAIAYTESRQLLWYAQDKPTGLDPWDKVRWARILASCSFDLAQSRIVIPTPTQAIAAYHNSPQFLSDLATWTATWQQTAATYPAPPSLTIALLCLSQWHPSVVQYSEMLVAIARRQPVTETSIRSIIGLMQSSDRDLLRLAKLAVPDAEECILFYHHQALRSQSSRISLHLDNNWIAASFDFDPSLQESVKALAKQLGSSKPWNPSKRQWQLPLRSLTTVLRHLPDASIDPALQCKVLAQRQRADQIAALRQQAIAALDTHLPDGRPLFHHQIEGSRIVAAQPTIVADDMGLGKTIMALIVAKAFRAIADLDILVIAPASLKHNWQREADLVGVPIAVCSWAKIPDPPERDFVLIADEAHYAQSGGRTARGKKFLDLATCDRAIATIPITGTPMKNGRPIEMLPLLQAIAHPIAEDVRRYETRYCAAKNKEITIRGGDKRSVWDNKGASNMDELHRLVKNSLLRRYKSDCLDLPPKLRSLRPVELSAAADRRYRDEFAELQRNYHERVAAGEISGDSEAMVQLAHLRHAASHAKIETAIALAEEAIAQRQSIVLFTEFATTAVELNEALRSHGTVLLTGKTPKPERQAIVDRFQSGEAPIFIGTIRAGGVGLTLTRSSIVVLIDRPWSPGDAEQAEDRCHRIGTTANVYAIWLQLGELDERVDQVLANKSDVINLVLAGKRKTLRGVKDPRKIAKAIADSVFKLPANHVKM